MAPGGSVSLSSWVSSAIANSPVAVPFERNAGETKSSGALPRSTCMVTWVRLPPSSGFRSAIMRIATSLPLITVQVMPSAVRSWLNIGVTPPDRDGSVPGEPGWFLISRSSSAAAT